MLLTSRWQRENPAHRYVWFMSSLLRVLSVAIAFPLMATASHAEGGAAVSDAAAPIEAFYATLSETMQQGPTLGLDGRRTALGPAVDRAYDVSFMASRALGRGWRELSSEQRSRWVRAFRGLTVNTYAERFAGPEGPRFAVDRVEESMRGTAMVFTHLAPTEGEPVELRYRMRRGADDAWRIIDIFLNGTVSELALRHSEYTSVVEREGFEHLVASVEAKAGVTAAP